MLHYLRSWGYCLWDKATLDGLNFWTQVDAMSTRAEAWFDKNQRECEAACTLADATRDARRLIYSRGGYGWYTPYNMQTCNITWWIGDEKDHVLPPVPST